MKRSNFYFFGDFCANGRGKPFSHLARCLIGECDRAYRFWIVATFFDKVHYTWGQHLGFPASGSGQDLEGYCWWMLHSCEESSEREDSNTGQTYGPFSCCSLRPFKYSGGIWVKLIGVNGYIAIAAGVWPPLIMRNMKSAHDSRVNAYVRETRYVAVTWLSLQPTYKYPCARSLSTHWSIETVHRTGNPAKSWDRKKICGSEFYQDVIKGEYWYYNVYSTNDTSPLKEIVETRNLIMSIKIVLHYWSRLHWDFLLLRVTWVISDESILIEAKTSLDCSLTLLVRSCQAHRAEDFVHLLKGKTLCLRSLKSV